jgi:hypothetical protein
MSTLRHLDPRVSIVMHMPLLHANVDDLAFSVLICTITSERLVGVVDHRRVSGAVDNVGRSGSCQVHSSSS